MKSVKIQMKKVMSGLLVLVLVLGFVPVSVSAAPEVAGVDAVSANGYSETNSIQPEEGVLQVATLYAAGGDDIFLNSGYPYGKDMNSSTMTLVIETTGASSYQWQWSSAKDGTYEDINGATSATYTFTPTSGYWYRCVANGVASKAVMAVKPGNDGRSWTKPYSSSYNNKSWYISNGSMAYVACNTLFDAVGLYSKNGTDYMLCTSFGSKWDCYSESSPNPSAGSLTSAQLDALRVAFDESDDFNIFFEADLQDGQQAFSFGCDTQLGNDYTSGSYSDRAALAAMTKNGVLQQVSMIGAASIKAAKDDDPAFVIAPVDSASRFWIGSYSSRKTYAYNTSGGTAKETIDGQNVVTLVESTDSGMTMSWMNIPSGGCVKFRFSVGTVANTGAVNGKVDYEKEALTGLEPKTKYDIITDNVQYTIMSDENGEIPLSGTDTNGKNYDFVGKKLIIAKNGSSDTPAEVDVADRPETPDIPSDLEEDEGGDNTPTLDSNIEIVELSPNSVTISPKEGQQYAYSTDGVNWTTLTDRNTKGYYVISNLSQGATVNIKTRFPATSSSPASNWSEPKTVQLKSTVEVSVSGWNGTYDGENHNITLSITSLATGAKVSYSTVAESNYSSENPGFRSAGTYTVYYRAEAEGYYPAYGSATVSINKKVLSVTGVEVDSSNAIKQVLFSGLIGGDELKKDVDYSANNLNLQQSGSAQVASLMVELKNSAEANNYQLTSNNVSGVPVYCHQHTWKYQTDETNKSVVKAYCTQEEYSSYCLYYGKEHEIALTITAQDVIYSGAAYNGALVNDEISAVTGVLRSDILYFKSAGKDSTNKQGEVLASAPTDVGNYVAVCNLTENNGMINMLAEAKAAFSIEPVQITDADVNLTSNTLIFSGEELSPQVVVKVGNNTLICDRDYIVSGDLCATQPGDAYEITVEGINNYKGVIKRSWKILDKTPPTGSINIKDNAWNGFLNQITFGKFFNDTQRVTIAASDRGSGIDKIFYYVSDVALSAEQVAALSDDDWTQGTAFDISPAQTCIIYAKITDKSGNVTYISSDGVILDAENPLILGVTNGKTYCFEKTISITDANLDKVYINDREITLTDNMYTLQADNSSYLIKAVDCAGNTTIAMVTVNETHTYGAWETITEPTCTEKGLRKKFCVFCNDEIADDIAPSGHRPIIDSKIEPNCTESGLTEGSHCEVCDTVLISQDTIEPLGHAWSDEWNVIREATESQDGKKETTCTRGCRHKKVVTFSADDNTGAGTVEKGLDIAPDVLIKEATLDNKKDELLHASNIFTNDDRSEILQGAASKVWVEITKTEENEIPEADKMKIKEAAESKLGSDYEIIYFDASLFKQVGNDEKVSVSEPGIPIRITIHIPDSILNHNPDFVRKYLIIRQHIDSSTSESSIDVLDGIFDQATGDFVFETDRFSTYAIAYSDIYSGNSSNRIVPFNNSGINSTNMIRAPKTGEEDDSVYWCVIGMIFFLLLTGIWARKNIDKSVKDL